MEGNTRDLILHIINEAHKNPDECMKHIANEAFERFDIPLDAHWSHDDREPIELKHR